MNISLEPPLPPGLKKLSPALKTFTDNFGLDPFLVQAAAEASPELNKSQEQKYGSLVGHLSRDECDDFLSRLAEGEPGVGLALRKRLAEFLPKKERPQGALQRPVRQLIERAEQLKNEQKKRQAQAAHKKHIAEMKALAAKEEQTWQKVEDLLDNGRKIASVYDEATGLLEKLHQLSEFQDNRDDFRGRLLRLAEKYSSRPSLIGRWRTKGWIS